MGTWYGTNRGGMLSNDFVNIWGRNIFCYIVEYLVTYLCLKFALKCVEPFESEAKVCLNRWACGELWITIQNNAAAHIMQECKH